MYGAEGVETIKFLVLGPPVEDKCKESFFFYEAAIVLQQYKIVSGSKYTLRTYQSFFPCQ